MFIGRATEIQQLKKALGSDRAELGIVYGRRRIGKTSLLRSLLERPQDLYFEAIHGLSKQDQIDHFLDQLAEQTNSLPYRANSWKKAFKAITPVLVSGKRYVVFDEFPWMASERSSLVAIFKYFWDNEWKQNSKLKLVLCGSIAQFMVKHLVHSTALHNRKTFEMKLDPLPAKEAKYFFRENRSLFEIAQFLMTFGCIPKYLEQLDPNKSLSLNIDQNCFNKNGFFYTEFETLFKEQFRVVRTYEKIISALGEKSASKEELARKLNVEAGGGFTEYLINLERADFIKHFHPISLFGGKKIRTGKYKLWDEWLSFYLKYVRPNRKAIEYKQPGKSLFEGLTSKSLDSYFGLQFERMCLKNIPNILERLEIDSSEIIDVGPYFKQGTRRKGVRQGVHQGPTGAQIDLMLYRKGGVLTLIECKFTTQPVGPGIVSEIEQKISLLAAPKHVTFEKVLISALGVTPELESQKYFHQILDLEAVF